MTTCCQPPPASADLQSDWRNVLLQLKTQIDPAAFKAYVCDSQPLALENGILTVAVPSAYARDWCSSRLSRIASRQFAPLIGCPVEVRFAYLEPEPGGAGPDEDEEADGPPEAAARGPEMQSQALGDPADEGFAAQRQPAAQKQPAAQMEDDEDDPCGAILLEETAGTIEAALLRPGRIVAFPRYELRFLPLVGPENFFLRLAFLQERYFHTPEGSRGQPFEASVESLLRWAHVGRATLHRFKKGDAARAQLPAAGWFGIEQLPSAPRRAGSQQQPPCRYRLQQGIGLTPMDADRLREQLTAAGIRQDPLPALQALCSRPVAEILEYPPPAPSADQRRRAPVFTSVAQVVQSALGPGWAGAGGMSANLRAGIADWTARLSDHITMPHQMVHVSWYFLREWLPRLGHAAAALVLYARAQGYYNPQTHELRDEIHVSGGYGELARVTGLKRDRTIGDWLPNIFESQPRRLASRPPAEDKYLREQQRQQQAQDRIARFVQVVPGSRQKTPGGHYAFNLRVQITADPLTPADAALRGWVQQALAECAREDVLPHFFAWAQSEAVRLRAQQLDLGGNADTGGLGEGAGGAAESAGAQNDGWGILAARLEAAQAGGAAETTARESDLPDEDGWGILAEILVDSWGILARSEVTAGELFKGLLRLNTYWETIRKNIETTPASGAGSPVVVERWDLAAICRRNGGINPYRAQILAQNSAPDAFLSWLFYAYSFKGQGIHDPVGWALARLKEQPGSPAEGLYQRLAGLPPGQVSRLLYQQIETGLPPADGDWKLAFRDTPLPRLRELAETLGLQAAG